MDQKVHLELLAKAVEVVVQVSYQLAFHQKYFVITIAIVTEVIIESKIW